MSHLLRRRSLIILLGIFLIVGYSLWRGYSATSMAASGRDSAVAASVSRRAPGSAPPARTASMEISPAAGAFSVGTTFAVRLVIKGGGHRFDTAAAVVTLNGPVTVTSFTLEPAHSGGCGFTLFLPYPLRTSPGSPRAHYLSFAGAVMGGSTTDCTLYTLHLRVTGAGAFRIVLHNAGVYADGKALLSPSGLVGGTYRGVMPVRRLPTIVAHVSPLTVKGGLTKTCHMQVGQRSLPAGCVLISSVSAPGAAVVYTIVYPRINRHQITQSFTDKADVRGYSQHVFNVPYVPPVGARPGMSSTVALVKVSATLPNRQLLKNATLSFTVVR